MRPEGPLNPSATAIPCSSVVVNKTFLGHPQQSLVFPLKFNSSKNPPQTPFKFPQSSHKSDFSKTRQIHQNSFGPVGFDEEFVGWGVCWKLGEIFVGKRGIVEDVPEMFY